METSTKQIGLLERERRQRGGPAQAAAGVVLVAVSLRLGWGLLRAVGSALRPPSSRVVPEPEEADTFGAGEEEEEGPPPTARSQWLPSPDPPPAPPADARLVAAADLPVSVFDFYARFLSVESTALPDHHVASGQTSFRSTRWRADGAGAIARTFTFVQPKRGIASMPARCTQRHRLSVHPGPVMALMTDMKPADIPYADSFRVQSFWTVSPDASGGSGCRVEVRVAVPFSRWCVLQRVITSASVNDCKDFFRGFLDKAASEVAAASEAGSSPGASTGPVDAEVLLPPDQRLLVPIFKPGFAAPGAAGPPASLALVRLQSLVLLALLLLQAALLWELLVLRRQLGAALPDAFGHRVTAAAGSIFAAPAAARGVVSAAAAAAGPALQHAAAALAAGPAAAAGLAGHAVAAALASGRDE